MGADVQARMEINIERMRHHIVEHMHAYEDEIKELVAHEVGRVVNVFNIAAEVQTHAIEVLRAEIKKHVDWTISAILNEPEYKAKIADIVREGIDRGITPF